MKHSVALLFALATLTWSARGHAEATFVIRARDNGLVDPTPVAAEGGNSATTLGEQRKAVLERAAALWAERLESSVPIVVDVHFRSLGCGEHTAALAGANALDLFSGIEAPDADPALWYPSPLANRLAGIDLAPDQADIKVIVNVSIDQECRSRFHGFYYGFDGNTGGRADLLETLLHELAHGLGFSSFVDLQDGMPDESGIDVFSAHILDLSTKKTWREMSNEERRMSALKVRGLAFQGSNTTKAAAALLAKGSPSLRLDPSPAGFLGAVGENDSYTDFEGPVRLAGTFDGCVASSSANLSGALVLIRPQCSEPGQLGPRLRAAGVAGALIVLPTDYDEPAISNVIWQTMSGVPSQIISVPDAELMRSALMTGPLYARAHWDPARLAGADAEGRPLLFASRPADEGSSVSHFEPLARPDLLMEPFSADLPHHSFDLTGSVLLDLGWTVRCGNHVLDAGEECDEGEANSDTVPNACRKRCLRARCGDGIVDGNETCDQGKANSDTVASACRTTCLVARCGDGVVDTGEACDRGPSNDDTLPNACRRDCRTAGCGDHVVDDLEQCDGSQDCSPVCKIVVPEEPVAPIDAGHFVDDEDDPNAPVWRPPNEKQDGSKSARKTSSGCSVAGESRDLARAQSWGFGLVLSMLALRRGRRSAAQRARGRP